MQPIQYIRYRTCHGANEKKQYERCRYSSDISSTSQKYYSVLDLLHKLVSSENSI